MGALFLLSAITVSGQQTSCMEDTRPCVSTGENECDSRTADNCPLIKEEDNLSIAKQYYDSAYPCVMNYEWIEALSHLIKTDEINESLPEDMTDEEMHLTAKAYYQMGYVFDMMFITRNILIKV